MVEWQYQLNGHESEQTLGHSGGQGAWRSVVHRTANRHNLVTKQQQQQILDWKNPVKSV